MARAGAAGLATVADARVRAAVTALVLDEPFFGDLALRLELRADPSCQTAWVDGKTLGYNPAFVAGLTDEELKGLVAHEVMHCACLHPWRRDGRDPENWNKACDYVINGLLVDSGFRLPQGALLSSEFSGRFAEWVYDRLGAPGKDEGGDQGQGQPGDQDAPGGQPGDQDGQPGDQAGSPDSDVPGDGGQPGEVRDAPQEADAPSESEWEQAVEQAARVCQGQGSLPGGLARGLAAAKAPAVDWRAALRKYVQEVCTADYTWTRPNVRYLAQGLFLPSLRAERCGRIVVAVDTSGSIDDVLLAQFGAELQAIVDEVNPAGLTVIYCDSLVQHVDEYEPGDPVKLSAHGGGGTAFEPVFAHVAQAQDEPPAVLVYLTDLDGEMPDTTAEYPVIWAVTGRHNAGATVPFGDIIGLD